MAYPRNNGRLILLHLIGVVVGVKPTGVATISHLTKFRSNTSISRYSETVGVKISLGSAVPRPLDDRRLLQGAATNLNNTDDDLNVVEVDVAYNFLNSRLYRLQAVNSSTDFDAAEFNRFPWKLGRSVYQTPDRTELLECSILAIGRQH